MSSPKAIEYDTCKVTVDGNELPRVQKVVFEVSRNRQQKSMDVFIKITVRSLTAVLDNKIYEKIAGAKPFQMIIELYAQGSDQLLKKITFDECVLEGKTFAMDTGEVGLTTYKFAATRVEEE